MVVHFTMRIKDGLYENSDENPAKIYDDLKIQITMEVSMDRMRGANTMYTMKLLARA